MPNIEVNFRSKIRISCQGKIHKEMVYSLNGWYNFNMQYFGVNKIIRILLLFLFIVNMSEGLFAPILAVFVTESFVGASLRTMGFAIAIYSIVKSLIQVPLARRIDKKVGEKDDFHVMMIGALIGVFYTFGFLLIKTSLQFYLLSALGGIGGAFLMAAYYGIFSRHVDKCSQGFEWSLFSVGGLTISTAIGAAVGGVYTDAFGFNVTFITAGILNTVAMLLLVSLYPFMNKKTNFQNP